MMNLLTRFYIRDKQGRKVLFKPNKAQIHFLNNMTGRDIILKARQLGFTTLVQLTHLRRIMLDNYTTVATVAHKQNKLKSVFEIARFAWDNLPPEVKNVYEVRYDNVRELTFSANGSRYFVDLDLRSSTVQHLHVSEFAFLKDVSEMVSATFSTVPDTGSIVLETTANGLNSAYDFWQKANDGKVDFTPHFYNWTWAEEYQATPPENNKWKEDYKYLAKRFNLIVDIQSKHQLTNEQFFWYYQTANLYEETMKQEYPTVPEEAFLSSSISVFDLFKVVQLKGANILRAYRGVNIYEEPKVGHKYCIGVDTSEGIGGDNTAVEIWDITDHKEIVQVASFSDSSIRPDQTASLVIELGNLYNDAFLIPERNSSGLSTVLKLQEEGYRNLFVNRQIDKKTQKSKNEYGWRTMGANREVMIDDFIELFENGNLVINSSKTIQEMKTFVRKESGKREHDEGYHDDSLFASFLAIQGIKYYRDKKLQILNKDRLGL